MDNDNIICPITGKEIAPGEGQAVSSRSGNIWIVHRDAPLHLRRTDDREGPQRINGHAPLGGPDAIIEHKGV